MQYHKNRPWYLDYLLIILGTGIMAIAIKSVFDSAGLVTGGFSGAAIIVKEWTKGLIDGGLPLWFTNLVMNVPLFFLGIKIKGFSFVKKALLGEICLSFWLYIEPVFPIMTGDYFLSSIYGGCILGVGIGLVFLGQGTTGGTDMMAAIIQNYMKHYTIAQIMQVIDGMIVVVGAYVFGLHRALYAIIAVLLVTKVSDSMIEGLKFAKGAYIITARQEEVAQKLMRELDRGVTGIHVTGMHSMQEKVMLFCVVSKKQIIRLKELVSEVDPEAFVIVSDVREVLGKGFTEEKKWVKINKKY